MRLRLAGTLAPPRRASLSPIAMACLRLLTLRLDRPERSWPRYISCIARPTFLEAAVPYLRREAFFFLAAA